MTEKRFIQSRHWCIDKIEKRKTTEWDTIIKWLNELDNKYVDEFALRETLQLELQRVEKENEQLKKENYELHKRLGDFEPFERYMEERTSKTSVNDIIGLVKTDESTDSVELKKEVYK